MEVKEVVNTNTIRTRIAGIEYNILTPESIKAIYYEEMGKELTVNEISIYHSQDYEKELGLDKTGFDATIIHLFDEKEGINEFIFVPRGSEMRGGDNPRPLDWLDNLMSIFVGHGDGQYNDAKRFVDKILRKIEQNPKYKDVPLTKIAYGHSKAGNISQVLQIYQDEDEKFDKVYVFNDAPPTVYQLAYIDKKFYYRLAKEFNLKRDRDIYNINSEDLVNFAKEYYKEEAVNIHHIVAEEDLLYNLSLGIRGFVHFGEYTIIDTNSEFDGISNFFANIPDDVLAEIQQFLYEFGPVYNEEGFDGFIRELLGVDPEFVANLLDYKNLSFFEKVALIKQLVDNLPRLLEHLQWLLEKMGPILDFMAEQGYDIREDIRGIVGAIKRIVMDKIQQYTIISFGKTPRPVEDELEIINQHFDNIKQILDDFAKGVEGHSLQSLINAFEGPQKRYDSNGNLVFTVSSGGKTIHVNSTVLLQIYYKGLEVCDFKEKILNDLKTAYYEEYIDDYEARKRKLIAKIEDMEANYKAYESELDVRRGYSIRGVKVTYELTGIRVDEDIPQLHSNFKEIFDNLFETYEFWIQDQLQLLNRIKKGIDAIFEADYVTAMRIFG